jgi:hypothetical protein
MKRTLSAFLSLLFLTVIATAGNVQANKRSSSLCCDVQVVISGAEHLEEVFATLSIGGYPVSDRVSSQVLREFDFHVNPDYSADFTVWGSKCRTCKIKKHYATGKQVPKVIRIQLRSAR